ECGRSGSWEWCACSGPHRLLFRELARLALQRTRLRAQLEREAGQGVHEVVGVEAIHDELAAALAENQVGGFEQREMARDRRGAHREALGDLAGGELARGQVREDLASRGGGEGFENAVGGHEGFTN